MATPNLNITAMTSTQSQKEVTANAAFTDLDNAICNVITANISAASVGFVMPASTVLNSQIEFVGSAPVAVVTCILPAVKHIYVVRNSTAQDIRLQTSALTNASGCTIVSNTFAIVSHTGSGGLIRHVVSTVGAAASSPYDVGGYFPAGASVNNQVISSFIFVRSVDFPPALTGSKARLITSTTGATTFSLKRNGTEFGQLKFGAGDASATFSAVATAVFSTGDYLQVVAPASADATAAGLFYVLAGRRL